MSIRNWEDEQEDKRKWAEGWRLNEYGRLVPPQKKKNTEKKSLPMTQEDIEKRIDEANVENARILPTIVPEKEPEAEETEQTVPIEQFIKTRRKIASDGSITRRMSIRILERVKDVESTLDQLITLSQLKKDDKQTLVVMTKQEKKRNLIKSRMLAYGRITRAGWSVAELKKRGITVEDIMNGKPLPTE